MTYIKRDLQQIIKDNLTRPEIIAIIGPRQSGKTTLMRYIFNTLENAEFISFEVSTSKVRVKCIFELSKSSTQARFLFQNNVSYP